MENMRVFFLEREGGAKRVPWQKTLNPESQQTNGKNNAPAGCKIFGSSATNPTGKGTGLSNYSSKEVPKALAKNLQAISVFSLINYTPPYLILQSQITSKKALC